ncbi:uncharacterized protein B0H18DRAFT_684719 [Fomitopsis serialis]|uniref:uncharacterized protein n=1 Tax=Fomitopsis serialis TaxID=139415 RepID=UPI002007DAB6|nr:uncharacterized protein B0H18DRAFT_684719 [Neoantrodia serialis]KAH9918021.1 hypothetical protein B0H18DRAFT_684719 [Neoantrodia serialis]
MASPSLELTLSGEPFDPLKHHLTALTADSDGRTLARLVVRKDLTRRRGYCDACERASRVVRTGMAFGTAERVFFRIHLKF